jgi:uncharacterized protein YrrD
MERYSKRTLMMPVYSIQEGQNLGMVKGIVIDPKEKSIIALVLERRRMTKEERIVPFINIKSIGDNVVIIDKAINAERRNNLPAITRYMRNPVQLIGSKVFTTGGKTLGRVEEYRYDGENGRITALEISGGMGNYIKGHISLAGQYIITIAPATVMVDEEAIEHLEELENTLRSSMENAKEKAESVITGTITGTIEASKKISQNISQVINKKQESPGDPSPKSTAGFDIKAEEEAHITEPTAAAEAIKPEAAVVEQKNVDNEKQKNNTE